MRSNISGGGARYTDVKVANHRNIRYVRWR